LDEARCHSLRPEAERWRPRTRPKLDDEIEEKIIFLPREFSISGCYAAVSCAIVA